MRKISQSKNWDTLGTRVHENYEGITRVTSQDDIYQDPRAEPLYNLYGKCTMFPWVSDVSAFALNQRDSTGNPK